MQVQELIHQANPFYRRFASKQGGPGRCRTQSGVAMFLTALIIGGGTCISQDGCRPELDVGPELEVAATETALRLFVRRSPECPPEGTSVYISGLAPSAELSSGFKIAPGSWAIPIWALENLKVRVPAGFVGDSSFSITLLDDAGRPLSVRTMRLYAKAPAIGAMIEREADAEQPKEVEITTSPKLSMPASTVAPPPTQSELAQAKRMFSRGEQVLAQGNIVIGREYLKRAAALGFALAALRLAETYDPLEFQYLKVFGLKHDRAEAKTWYERAIELGAAGAEAKLRRLGTR